MLLELDDAALLNQFKDKLPTVSLQLPEGYARMIQTLIANVPMVKEVGVAIIPRMLSKL